MTDSLFNLLSSKTHLDNPESRTQDANSERTQHDADASDSSMSDQVDSTHSATILETVQNAIPNQTCPVTTSTDIDIPYEDPFPNHVSPGMEMDPPTNSWPAPRQQTYSYADVNESFTNSEYFGLMNRLLGFSPPPAFESIGTDQFHTSGSREGNFPPPSPWIRQPDLVEGAFALDIPWSLVEEL